MNLGYNIVFFISVAIHVSAEASSTCGVPPSYPHTKVADKYIQLNKYNHGEKVIYRCAESYTESRGIRSIMCDNGKWTRLKLKCEKKTCGSAGDLFNGYFNYTGSLFGDKAYAVCNEGFTLKGMEYRTCKDSVWTGEIPTCEEGREPQISQAGITCPYPSVANSMKLGEAVSVYRVRDSVTIVCSEGFLLTGDEQITCGPDGQWQTQLPQCLPSVEDISCTPPKTQERSTFTVISGLKEVYRPQDSLSFSCINNYHLNGSKTVTCGLDGKWNPPLPNCTQIKCPPLKVENGKTSTNHRRPGSEVIITCYKGHIPKGVSRIVCSPLGRWMGEIPLCVPGTCGVPPFYPNRHLSQSYLTKTNFSLGDRVRYSCGIGYMRVRGTVYSTCVRGNWTPLTLRCERKSCGSAGEIDFGNFVYTGVEFGDTATGVCNEGFQLVGQNVRHCMNDGWDGRVPVCEPVQCVDPPEVINGEMDGNLEPPHIYRTVINYRCRKGKLIGASEIYCTKDGTWSAPPPECKDIKCPYPRVPNARRIGGITQPLVLGDTLTFVCYSGFVMEGPDTVKCGLDGTWMPALPTCN
ncbi:CUB and sushi domain-containing protein 1 [Esox lucius]|uniref:CUB and sushi domain-containing protein 1 n=1 Tax=Esox lucius TaxID=8010 RepID=UPI001476C27E|nr:CUB and sushi domain-containing protein 1 [Esox lucius]